MTVLKIKILPIVIINSILLFQLTSGTAWLKLCGETESYLIEAGQCPNGVRFSHPIAIQCVCAHGIWVLSNGACDANPYLLVAHGGSCYNLKGDTKSEIKYIGRPSTPYVPATYIASEWLDSFWKLPSGSKTSRDIVDLPRMVILNVFNSDKAVSAKNTACCVRDNPEDQAPIFICYGAPSGDYVLRSRCHPSGIKAIPELKTISLNYGQGVHFGGKGLIGESTECSKCAKNHNYTFNTGCCKALAWEDEDDIALVDTKRYDKQTYRFVVSHLDFTLKNKRGFQMDTFEFQQLRYASATLKRVCPKEHVPTELVNTFLRFFRQAVNESMMEFPIEKTMDSAQNRRIMTALDQCLDSASTPWNINVNDNCGDPIYQLVAPNGSVVLADMPDNQKFDPERFDLVMETAWKLIEFIFYYCSPQLDSNQADASYLFSGLERFFNTDLTKRWTHPGNGFKVFKFILSTYDLEKFMGMIDACVTFAKSACQARKPWLVRPFLRKRKVNKKSMPLWNNTALCLTSYYHPLESYQNECGASDDAFWSVGAAPADSDVMRNNI